MNRFEVFCKGAARLGALAAVCMTLLASCATAPDQDAAAQAARRKAVADYQMALAQRMERYKRYPAAAVEQNRQGAALVHGTIGADGRLAEVSIERTSGHADLDELAKETMYKAKPLVAVPAELRGRAFEVHVRVVYTLDKDGAHQHGDEPGTTHPR